MGRKRSKSALTLAEREEISRAVVMGSSIRAIAASLGRAPSTIHLGSHEDVGDEEQREREEREGGRLVHESIRGRDRSTRIGCTSGAI